MIPSPEVIATLAYLIPGFVAVKAFSVIGLGVRRTDLELALWSVLAAAAINLGLDRLALSDPSGRLLSSIAIAIVLGFAAGRSWAIAAPRWQWLRAGTSDRAWDVVLAGRPGPWVQVWTSDGRVVLGWVEIFASASVASTLDLYIRDPSWVDAQTQQRTPMTGVKGVLIREASIERIQLFKE